MALEYEINLQAKIGNTSEASISNLVFEKFRLGLRPPAQMGE